MLLDIATAKECSVFFNQADCLRMINTGICMKFAAGSVKCGGRSEQKDQQPFAGV